MFVNKSTSFVVLKKIGNDLNMKSRAYYATVKDWGIFILSVLKNVHDTLLSKKGNLENLVQ